MKEMRWFLVLAWICLALAEKYHSLNDYLVQNRKAFVSSAVEKIREIQSSQDKQAIKDLPGRLFFCELQKTLSLEKKLENPDLGPSFEEWEKECLLFEFLEFYLNSFNFLNSAETDLPKEERSFIKNDLTRVKDRQFKIDLVSDNYLTILDDFIRRSR
jgi:hypothetical protein